MNDKNRRKALKVIAASAPVVYVKPVISTAVMPAHAQISPGCEISIWSAETNNDPNSATMSILFAGAPGNTPYEIALSSENNTIADVEHSLSGITEFDGQIELDGRFIEFNNPATGTELTIEVEIADLACEAETNVMPPE